MAGAVVWLAAPFIADFFRMDNLAPVVRVLAVVFPVMGFSTVAESLLQREMRFRLLANVDVVTYGIGYGLGIVLALLGWGTVVARGSPSYILASPRSGSASAEPPRLRPSPTGPAFRELMDYGVGQSAGRIGVFLANQADNLVVGRFLGAPHWDSTAEPISSWPFPRPCLATCSTGCCFPPCLGCRMIRAGSLPRTSRALPSWPSSLCPRAWLPPCWHPSWWRSRSEASGLSWCRHSRCLRWG